MEGHEAEKTAGAASRLGNPSLKRKRSDADEMKLKEFLEIMQSKSTPKTWATQDVKEPPKKVQAIELPEAESDSEYEIVPKVSKEQVTQAKPAAFLVPSLTDEAKSPESGQEDPQDLQADSAARLDVTDDDWVRSRTNRLLDLMDPTDIAPPKTSDDTPNPSHLHEMSSASADVVVPVARETIAENVMEAELLLDELDPTIEAIRSSGRLFLRNLPYSATEDDLRKYFESWGILEEVLTFQLYTCCFMMNIQIGTPYAFKAYDVSWTNIFVDASCFLKSNLSIYPTYIVGIFSADELIQVHLPVDSSGKSKGFAFIQFEDPSVAVEAYHSSDGKPFQGRLLHVMPAAAKRENKLDEFTIAKLPLKKQKLIKKKAEASTSTFNWNSLYMSQDAVNASIADRLGVSKSDLLDPTSADAGVKQAIAETSIIQETKSYFIKNGVDLNAFKRRDRGDNAILVKNFPYGMSIEELRKIFEEFGQILRVLMPPAGTIAIVEFAQAPQARAAFANLAYRRVQDSVLFLEKAPKDLFTDISVNNAVVIETEKDPVNPKLSAADLLEKEAESAAAEARILFVKNLNFNTTSSHLTEVFKSLDGFMSARVNTKTDLKKPGQVLSMGFGFLEFRSKAQALAALKAMDGYSLDGHKLIIKVSNKGLDAAEERRREDNAKKLAERRTKIIIKNLPFEASKKEVRALFGTYGQLRSVRVPKKFNNSIRGFAFADFVTPREAENALEALKDTHLLGRRLVLEFAAGDPVDAEEEIEKMQKKVEKQVSKVALRKLTGGGRKKFNVNNANEDDQ